ncbi:hypothetical protein ACNFU2_20605 [Chryseobacterium sp. PTM-20240506]|uniref:hypothetical protein n=1 Tax=Chryseobacterium sp. PTM-20240506 TaxID=3400631 RepID=UPI003AAC2F6C
MVGKIKYIGIFLVFSIFFSCKKQQGENILKLAELSNYKIISKTRINDSITKINGENKEYTLEGNINTHYNSKQDWWKFRNKRTEEKYEIEYIFLNKQIENQIKIYRDGKLYEDASKFYTKSFDKVRFNFSFYFPVSKFKTKLVEFNYTISDSVRRKIIKEETLICKENNSYYSCSIPINENESVIGIVTKFSEFSDDKSDSIMLAADKIFVK